MQATHAEVGAYRWTGRNGCCRACNIKGLMGVAAREQVAVAGARHPACAFKVSGVDAAGMFGIGVGIEA